MVSSVTYHNNQAHAPHYNTGGIESPSKKRWYRPKKVNAMSRIIGYLIQLTSFRDPKMYNNHDQDFDFPPFSEVSPIPMRIL